jgi:hypothetical protein
MQTVWVMGNETEVLGKVPRPEVEGYLTYGGNVYGNESHWPTVVHYNDVVSIFEAGLFPYRNLLTSLQWAENQ